MSDWDDVPSGDPGARPARPRRGERGLRRRLAAALCALGCWLGWCACAAQDTVLITEIMARNARTLSDGEGSYPDWIELFNPTASPIDLGGWYLTDNPERLTRWRFPAARVEAGGYLVVFASGRDEVGAEGRLHTSFKLSGAGEYVGLVRPDGRTVASEIAGDGGRYPEQRDDVSYGLVDDARTTVLVEADHPARVAVPSDGAWGSRWTGGEEPFDDSAWMAGRASVGYGDAPGAGRDSTPLAYWPFDSVLGDRTPDEAGAHDAVVVEAQLTPQGEGRFGSALRFDGDDDFVSAGVIPELVSPSALTVSLWFRREADRAGKAKDTFHRVNNIVLAHSSDAANDNIEIGSEGEHIEIYLDTEEKDGPGPSVRQPAGIRDGAWYHLAVTYDRAAANELEVYLDGALIGRYPEWGGALSPSGVSPFTLGIANIDRQRWGAFRGLIDDVALWDRALSAGQIEALADGVPPVALSGFSAAVGLDLRAAMAGRNSSVYLRIPFRLRDPSALGRLTLEARYRSGFVAHLNGIEVARRNAPVRIAWDAAATLERGVRDALAPERLDLSRHLSALRAGDNILAIQGLNGSVQDQDFLLAPVLVGAQLRGPSLGYLPHPTPGAANRGGAPGIVSEVEFDVPRGFYQEPFELTLTTRTPGGLVRFTTDGSAPTERSGRRYQGPLRIGTTTVVRAAAFKDGWLASRPRSHTYLFLDDVIRQPARPPGFPATWHRQEADYEMDPDIVDDPDYRDVIEQSLRTHPTMSIATDQRDLFDPATGIYSNSLAKGRFWERAVSVELFDYPHGQSIQVEAGLRLQGNVSRRFDRPKHNMRLVFRREYGAARLRFPLYPGSPADRFDSVILRGQNGDSWIHPHRIQRSRAQYLRDQWHRDVQVAMGHRSINQGHVHLYLNGLYWGFYHIYDRVDAAFMAESFGGLEEDFDVVQDLDRTPGRVEATAGDLDAWNEMMALAERGGSSDALEAMREYLDLEAFVDYLLINFYSANTDWDESNWRAARPRDASTGFVFFPWDSERSIGESRRRSVASDLDVTGKSVANRATRLHQMLASNREYRVLFADRVHEHFFAGGVLTPQRAAQSWLARAEEIRPALVAEAARWGDAHRADRPYSPGKEWRAELRRLLEEFFPVRSAVVLEQLRRRGLYPAVPAPSLETSGGRPAHGVAVSIEAEVGEILYTTDGSDPRLVGGQVNPAAVRGGSVRIERPTTLRTRALLHGEWSALVEAQLRPGPASGQRLPARGSSGIGMSVGAAGRTP